jgi:hypothetical protein
VTVRLKKRPLPKRQWAVVDRYEHSKWTIFESFFGSKTEALARAHSDVLSGYTVNGRLSVVRVTIDVDTEIEITDAPRKKAKR